MHRRGTFTALSVVLLALAACGGDPESTSTGAGEGGGGSASASVGVGGSVTHEGLTARITATPEAGDGPLEVTLSGCTSTAEVGALVLYSWDFGDGTTATGPTVKHVFSEGAVMTKAADGALIWVAKAASSPVDLAVRVSGAGAVVISVDDASTTFAEPDAKGLVTVKGLDLASTRRVLVRSASAAQGGCNGGSEGARAAIGEIVAREPEWPEET